MYKKKYTKDEKNKLTLPKDEQRKLALLEYGAPLPEGYHWSDTGSLHNPWGHLINGKTRKKIEVTLKSQLLKYNGLNLNKIHKQMADIASGKDKKATKLQYDACKYIIDLFYNQELKSTQVNHSLEISFDEQLMNIALKTKEQKKLNDNKQNIIDV